MKKEAERRQLSRHGGTPALTCQLSLLGAKHNARGLNHSEHGISFESGFEIKPETILCLKRNRCAPDCPSGQTCNGCRSTTLATVRWCRKVEGSESDSYRIGATYFQL